MKTHLMPERLEKILNISALRTKYFTVVLENIHYTQNVSAVIRSCDCFGVQDVHLIGNPTSTKINKHVAIGASNWVDIHKRNGEDKLKVLKELKQKGYRIVSTLPDSKASTVDNFDIEKGKAAIILGNEMEGISKEVREFSDEFIYIPMFGFSESLNVSVSTAIIISQLCIKLRESNLSWQLSKDEIEDIRYLWVKQSIRLGKDIEAEYHRRNQEHPNDQL